MKYYVLLSKNSLKNIIIVSNDSSF